MPSFFDLPRELRDEIIALVVGSRISPPANDTRLRRPDSSRWVNGSLVFTLSSKASYCPPSNPLLYTNKQLYAETMAYVAQRRIVPTLDIAIINMSWFLPTWRIILPRTGTTLEKLNLNIVFASNQSSGAWRERALPFVLPPHLTLWGILYRFVSFGPVGDPLSIESDLFIHVKTVHIDFITSKPLSASGTFSEDTIPIRVVHNIVHNNDRSLSPAINSSSDNWNIDTWILELVHSLKPRPFPTREEPWYLCLLERIGKVVLSIDGVVKEIIDLEEFSQEVRAKAADDANVIIAAGGEVPDGAE